METYYKLVFSLVQFHKYSIADVENLMPFEREVYITMLNNHLEKQQAKAEERKARTG